MKYIGDVDVHGFPHVGNSVFYGEFHIGNMLPLHGSRDSYLKQPIDIEQLEEQLNIPDDSIIGLSNLNEKKLSNKERNSLSNTEFAEKECFDMFSSPTEAMMNEFFGESSKNKIPDLIEPIVKVLEGKGYQVRYASPGHANTRFSNDRNKDGVINSKFATTGRIIFSRDYKFSVTPQQWEWKVMDNGAKALYVKDYTYNPKQGTPEEGFKKYQAFYLDALKTWADKLPDAGDDEDIGEVDTNFDN